MNDTIMVGPGLSETAEKMLLCLTDIPSEHTTQALLSPTAWPRHQKHHSNSYMTSNPGNASASNPESSASSTSLSLAAPARQGEGKSPLLQIKTHMKGNKDISQARDACMNEHKRVLLYFESYFEFKPGRHRFELSLSAVIIPSLVSSR